MCNACPVPDNLKACSRKIMNLLALRFQELLSLSQVVDDIFGRRRKFHRREKFRRRAKFRRRETNFEIETLNSSSECYSTPLMGPAHQNQV